MAISKPFYTAVFETLGVKIVYQDSDSHPKSVGFGWDDMEPFTLFEKAEAAPHGRGTHLAFNAPSRAAVDAFYESALTHGGKGDGPPGLRKEIHSNYYCCFVYDPDSHRLEAVYQQPE